MNFLIADTFTNSLARLTGDEQKAVKTTAFDLQLNPANPGNSFHKLDHAKDKNFWSVRVSSDVRLIVHKTVDSLLLAYVDHHDKAYDWASRRKLETHPRTGAAQLVELRERVEERIVPIYVEQLQPARPKPPAPGIFARLSDDALLSYGVPIEWLTTVREWTEDTYLAEADHLPAEAAEALLQLATGGTQFLAGVQTADGIQISAIAILAAENQSSKSEATGIEPAISPLTHPDAQRRFRVIANAEELERALDAPWDRWTVFLHPSQRRLVDREYTGPARVAGSAGTGKTVVALHRAVHLARANSDSRVLLCTFTKALANSLNTQLRRLISGDPRLAERLEVDALNAVGERLYSQRFGKPQLATQDAIKARIASARAGEPDMKFGVPFLQNEWVEMVDAWQLASWEAYRDARRLGRKTRLTEKQRAHVWSVMAAVNAGLLADGMITHAGMFTRLAAQLSTEKHPPFDFIVLDEAQDVSIAQLKFLAAMGGGTPNGLFFAGDLGQRIFQQPFSWSSLGVDVRGRSYTLRVNYRTSHQIRTQADRLLGPEVTDVDGNADDRRGTVSVFNGPAPIIKTYKTGGDESAAVAAWLGERLAQGYASHEIGVFVRSDAELPRAQSAIAQGNLACKILDDHLSTTSGFVSLCTMHLAKGLEFRAVAVMACDDVVIPLHARINTASDDSDLEELYNTERQLLYVACTRARDVLLVTGVVPASEFLDDMGRNR